ncbi:hypothetical protein PC129_g19878 [Phytophthora cactorum]|uniref:Uncharacterized protein n=1 Tax=Phytophthora cactorum TaxID=29920 RepID=A0A8T0YDL0_9STRA|nr:hypothetical protein Pcac1_g27864 [Phytophthora cactorum]KAG2800340.1 hypothetical protein PC112_g20522 [Phytophthora cactorum]KAG2800695.1 hypothetical protein PC111_g19871 [Phytophthora cactorum]KAG2834278.1 hypothetical protein PC113_g20425 [Phytophthora cactorum]KAG2878196.1 hypothetical protein PC114_g23247 [Phytophthora cactorum]
MTKRLLGADGREHTARDKWEAPPSFLTGARLRLLHHCGGDLPPPPRPDQEEQLADHRPLTCWGLCL